jgi:hypothetical protein
VTDTATDTDDARRLEAIGSDALDRFIETFNSRDPRAWAASLSYPHVRVSPHPRTATFSPTEPGYANAVSYEAPDAMGWHHSAWDEKHVLAVSPTKIHASAQWCRYDAAGERILPNSVSYVITKVDERWGIQARFGVDSRPPEHASAVAEQATSVWRAWWRSLATGQLDDLEARSQFPFHVVETGAVHQPASGAELVRRIADASVSMEVTETTPLQVGERGVNIGVSLTGGGGRTHHGLFLVTVHDATSRVAAASLLG